MPDGTQARIAAAKLATQASTVHSLVSQDKWAESLAACDRMADLHANLATELALTAARSGMSQRRIADLLGVSPHALRGLKAEAAR